MRSENVTPDLPEMSLADRAKLAALIEMDGDSDLRTHILGAVGRSETGRGGRGASRPVVPERWSQIHVLDRLEEAFGTLAAMPMAGRPKAYGNGLPTPVQERIPLIELFEMEQSGQLEQMREDRNRVRLAATADQISRMDQALSWPGQFLAHDPDIAKAVQLRALWAAMRVDIRKRCQRRGLNHEAFNARWQAGVAVITGQLIARKVPVT